MKNLSQNKLNSQQIEAFYHDQFVDDQVRDFAALASEMKDLGVVVDLGGGVGHFAHRLKTKLGLSVRVIDMDQVSVDACKALGINAIRGDALAPDISGDESVVCFNLILHHLVSQGEKATRLFQIKALTAWHGKLDYLFVNEYIYESYLGNISGKLIYAITSSQILSAIGAYVARVIPAFKANTFGIGVRFRACEEWKELFRAAGYDVIDMRRGEPEPIALPLRGLFIKTIRRDSFRLEACRSR